MRILRCGKRTLDLTHPQIMGVLNITPDSFSDGGQFYRDNQLLMQHVLERAELMLSEARGYWILVVNLHGRGHAASRSRKSCSV